jgi:energy-coupling factor transporter ATP-binding protein EcfA2
MRINANNPYVGLRAFETDESILFFGRNDQTMELLQRLHKHHFVAVVGSSGSGKSSLLRAGLIPSLKAGFLVDDSDHWVIAVMKPGQSPLYNMTESLLCQVNPDISSDKIALLVEKIKEEGASVLLDMLDTERKNKNNNFFLLVDQFEELFRFAIERKGMSKKDEAIDFVNILLELTRQDQVPVFVVITMRSDFIGDCAHFNGLPEAMNESLYLVPRLNRIQMKLVIEGPAKLYGRRIDAALTSRLLNELGKVQDELPLLQHTLMRIWDNGSGKETDVSFNLQNYDFVGGIERALSKHADEAIIGMNESSLLLTKKIFQSLTAIDANGRKIRRPAYLSELKELTAKGEKEIMGVINLFVKDNRSFLLINNDMTRRDKIIDISHESLIRQWDTLSGWVDEEESSAAEYLQLTESANLKRQGKKDLLKGSELNIALEWFDKFKPTFAWAKKYNDEFKESIDYLKDSENALIKERMIETANSRRMKRIMISAFIFLSGLTAIAVFTAFNFIRLKNRAESTTLIFAARNILEKDPSEALSMVNESLLKHFDSASYRFLLNIYSENSFFKILVKKEKEITCFSYSRKDDVMLTCTEDSILQLNDFTGKSVHQFKVNSIINAATISPDGKSILTGSGSGDSTARLWNVKGDLLQEFKGHSKAIRSVAFSPDGKSVLTGAADNSAILWNLKGKLLAELKGHNGTVYSVAFSSDGNKILTGSADSIACLWDLSGNIIQKFIGHTDAIHTIDFSPDGTKIVTGSEDNTARVWKLNGQMIINYNNHKGEINSVSFSPDSKVILSGSVDRTANLWDLTGKTLQQFKGHNNVISAVSFTKDGKNVLTGSFDSKFRIL